MTRTQSSRWGCCRLLPFSINTINTFFFTSLVILGSCMSSCFPTGLCLAPCLVNALKMAATADGNTSNGLTVITYVNPAQLPQSVRNQTAVSNARNGSNPQMLTFLKIQPKALGIVQIMNGVVTLLLEIVLASHGWFPILPAIFCIPLIYIVSGSLSIRAEDRNHPHLIKNTLVINVISAVLAGITIILLSLDFPLRYSVSIGISGVLLVFSLLQMITSICISAFGCKAICCSEPVVQLVAVASSAPPYPPELREYNRTSMNTPQWNHLHTV